MNSTLKSLLFWMVLVVILALIWNFSAFQGASSEITFSDFMGRVKKQEVAEVTFVGNEITGKFTATDASALPFEPSQLVVQIALGK